MSAPAGSGEVGESRGRASGGQRRFSFLSQRLKWISVVLDVEGPPEDSCQQRKKKTGGEDGELLILPEKLATMAFLRQPTLWERKEKRRWPPEALPLDSPTSPLPAGADMEPRGRAAVAAGLGVMCMLAVAAEPRVAEDQGPVAPRRCLLSHYRSLDPRAVAAVKALRDSYGGAGPGSRPGSMQGAGSARGTRGAFQRRLAPSRGRRAPQRTPGRSGPCSPSRAAGGRAGADSPRCHEATVVFNLLRLLTRDLRLAAASGPCV
ncbi:PREDICTED: interferon lambda-4-like [Chinchilla lanigera]|uniref:interferon lambda-4-like n=1 Tax=Chinchilla lanigera TaxID=34839 RepID=UPI000696EE8A|nr:PREDICTED: interferon lambda-4-like [Chinchilla lanigera]